MNEEMMNEKEPTEPTEEVHEDEDGDIDCYKMPEGMNVEEGQTITVPSEMEFEARDGKLYIKKAVTIDGKPAEPMEAEEENSNNELDEETNKWRDEAKRKDQLGVGNQ